MTRTPPVFCLRSLASLRCGFHHFHFPERVNARFSSFFFGRSGHNSTRKIGKKRNGVFNSAATFGGNMRSPWRGRGDINSLVEVGSPWGFMMWISAGQWLSKSRVGETSRYYFFHYLHLLCGRFLLLILVSFFLQFSLFVVYFFACDMW